MREWVRLGTVKRCGGCGHLVDAGTPLQRISMTQQRWRLYRCQTCAVGPCPETLPTPVPVTGAQLATRMQGIGALAVQFQRPAPPPIAIVPKRKAYRGEPDAVQGTMLDTLPRRTRG